MFKFADNGPEFDFPPFEGAPRVYAIAAIPRSGSTLLSKALWATGRAGAPKNYFEPRSIADLRKRWGKLTIPQLRDRLIRHRTSPNGTFGFKVHWHEFVRYFSQDSTVKFESLLAPERIIYIRRIDKIRQAVSYARASQTQQYTSEMQAIKLPIYRRETILTSLNLILREEHCWEQFFENKNIVPLRIDYEELVTEYTKSVLNVAAHLGIALQSDEVGSPPIRRLADSVTEEWAYRFMVEQAKIDSIAR